MLENQDGLNDLKNTRARIYQPCNLRVWVILVVAGLTRCSIYSGSLRFSERSHFKYLSAGVIILYVALI